MKRVPAREHKTLAVLDPDEYSTSDRAKPLTETACRLALGFMVLQTPMGGGTNINNPGERLQVAQERHKLTASDTDKHKMFKVWKTPVSKRVLELLCE